MGATRTLFSIKTKFGFESSVHVKELLYGNMYRIVTSFCFLISTFTFHVVGPIVRRVFGFQVGNNSGDLQQGDRQVGSNCCDNSDVVTRNEEREASVVMEAVSMSSTNRYEFLSGKGISGFIEEPKTLSFTIHELLVSNPKKEEINSLARDESSTDKGLALEGENCTAEETEKAVDFEKKIAPEESLDTQEAELFNEKIIVGSESLGCIGFGRSTGHDSARDQLNAEVCDAGETEQLGQNSVIEDENEAETFGKENVCDKEEVFGLECGISNQTPCSPEDYSLPSDPKEESISSNDVLSTSNDKSGSFTYSFLTNKIIHEGFGMPESPEIIDQIEVEHNQEPETVFVGDQSLDSDDEFIELEPQKEYSVSLKDDSKLETGQENVAPKTIEFEDLIKSKLEDPESFEDTSFQEKKTSTHDVRVETELAFEHEDIIEQLKQELKLARTGGLQTIQEEPECEEVETPNIAQELKPLKIDEKKEYRHCIDEIQMIYKSYSDRMRKLDILNFQTMHAAGLLQMKDTIQSQTPRKASVTAMKALFSQPLWSCKGSAVVEPVKKVVADVHKDFEAVYVGQLCLSWEVIHWQYRKAQELQNYDSQELHQYNQVANEFQLFLVLLQRFIENEPFLGPRVQNYAKNRCVVRNLLQVPLIKDDGLKDNERREDDHEYAFTHQMLLETIEESMRTFWEFLRSDKDEFLISQAPISFEDSIDSELLLDVLSDLQKKEKKLKDMTRSGNCIIKKLQRNQEDGMPRTRSWFLAQVELKLISRVINMSKLTNDQLIWCHDKLGKINICNRKVLLEPSFLLFPC